MSKKKAIESNPSLPVMPSKIEMWPVNRLVPYKKNARTHSEEQIDQIAAAIMEFGWTNPILAESDGGLIAGEGRLLAARKLQLPEVPVIPLDHLTPAQKRALVIADNKLAMNAGWNEELLAAEIESLKLDEYNLDLIGFSDADLDLLLKNGMSDAGGGTGELPEAKLDHAAELQKEWNTAPGQLWIAGPHRLLCGDSTSEADVALLMDGKRAVLFATDPPYLVAYDGTNHPHKWVKTEEQKALKNQEEKARKNTDWSDKYTDVDSPELGEALYDKFVAAAVKIALVPEAAWYCWHASKKQMLLEQVWIKYGAFVHQQIIWAKDRAVLTRSWYMWQHEPCLFGWIKGKKPKRVAENYPATVWSFPTSKPGQTTDHPTQKPVELWQIPIRQHTDKDDLCYEPFSGSGTCLVAAQSLGRVCYAMEKSPPFVAVALQRLSEMGLTPELAK